VWKRFLFGAMILYYTPDLMGSYGLSGMQKLIFIFYVLMASMLQVIFLLCFTQHNTGKFRHRHVEELTLLQGPELFLKV